MNEINFIFLFIIPIFSFSQLHHDMISSQGNTKKISSGHYVTQTVGQLSVIGINKLMDLISVKAFNKVFG